MPQSLSQVILHVIFSTADRKCWLDDTIRDRAQAYIATLLRDADSYSWKSTRWNMMNVRSGIEKRIGVGTTDCAVAPPSEPDVRFSRIRLSGQWFPRYRD